MIQINDFAQANKVLARHIPQVKELMGKEITLERMMPLMETLGNPHSNLKIIHIAGTSGKTSTAYFISSLLKESGNKVGLTVSPHIDSVTERIQINLQPIDEQEFCVQLSTYYELIENSSLKPTYFELIISFVYWYFDKQKVDYAVIETGMGGLHDATNVARNSNKVCVITDIGIDHSHILGDTLAQIAVQKAGIIHTNNHVFMYKQTPIVMKVVQTAVYEQHATLNVLSDNDQSSREQLILKTEHLPDFQLRNWHLAKKVFDYIAQRDKLPFISDDSLSKSTQIVVPGRMDIMQVENKTVIMDGAHNQQKIQTFVKSFTKLYPCKKTDILLALKIGKEFQAVLPTLLPITKRLITTSFSALQDLPVKSIDPNMLAKSARDMGFDNVLVIENPNDAYIKLIGLPEKIKIITGSFYLLSCIRPSIISSND